MDHDQQPTRTLFATGMIGLGILGRLDGGRFPAGGGHLDVGRRGLARLGRVERY